MTARDPCTPGDMDAAERTDWHRHFGDHYDGDDDTPTLAECDRDEAEIRHR